MRTREPSSLTRRGYVVAVSILCLTLVAIQYIMVRTLSVHSDFSTFQFARLGLLNRITDRRQTQRFRAMLYPAVLDAVEVDGRIAAVPTNVHGENWLWSHRQSHENARVSPPESWPEFLENTDAFERIDLAPLAVGDQTWQQRILLSNVFVSTLGRDANLRFFLDLDADLLDDSDFERMLRRFATISLHSRSFGEGNWDEQVDAVAAGTAASLVMGDWAKGELEFLGHVLGKDFLCDPAPGTADSYMPVYDALLLGTVSEPAERAGQALLVDVLLDRSVSRCFSAF